MISFDDACKTVMDAVRVLDTERVNISQALNRILAEDVRSDMDMPPFDKAAMDGYACRRRAPLPRKTGPSPIPNGACNVSAKPSSRPGKCEKTGGSYASSPSVWGMS